MKKVALGLSTAVLTVSPIAVTAPAHAVGSTNIYHYSPDAGYDAAFSVKCNNGSVHSLSEGEHSYESQNCGTDRTYAVYVRSTEDLVCLIQTRYYGKQWQTIYKVGGWRELPQNFDVDNFGCVLKLNQ